MRPVLLALGVGCIAAGGCAATTSASRPHPAAVVATQAASAAPCPVVTATTTDVVRRIYAQAASGRNVVSATRRLRRSTALAAAVGRGDPVAVRRALVPLLKHQIRRIVIRRGSRVLAHAGQGAALAPVTGVLRDGAGRPVARYTLSVADAAAFAGVTRGVTGAQVVITAHGHVVAQAGSRPAGGQQVTLHGRAYPGGMLTIRLALAPPPAGVCGASAAAARADTIAAIGRRLFAAEASGAQARRVVRTVTADRGLRAAVAADDPVGLRAAIVRLFGVRRLHVVRIRATTASGTLINDVGGPDVLAPIGGDVRGAGGGVIGHVLLSVQDDTGYIKLAHRFTGADVVLRTPAGVIAGSTLRPTAPLPDRGTVALAGRTYVVRSFAATAFPSGPLTISLLTR